MKPTSSLLVAVLAAFALPVLAQTQPVHVPAPTPSIDQRHVNQQKRVDQGVQSGQLTQKEAAHLETGQEHVQKVEGKARADGVVTKKEHARIQQAENVQSRHVAKQKHDRQNDRNHDGKTDHPGTNK